MRIARDEESPMKNFIFKLSMISVLVTPAAAWSQQALNLIVTPPAFQQNFQNANLPSICGDGKTDEGEQCDEGQKNGDRCASCTSDCRFQWMPADCSDETTPSLVIADPNKIKLTPQQIAQLLGANDDSNVNHTTMAPPAVGT